jgi:hypothetical protein
MRRVLEQYVLASCCFGRFLDRPLNPASALESTHLYPPSEPRLASHRLFIEHLYSRLSLLDAEDISRLRKEILPELEQTYALKPSWLNVFQQEVLDLLVHTKTTDLAE